METQSIAFLKNRGAHSTQFYREYFYKATYWLSDEKFILKNINSKSPPGNFTSYTITFPIVIVGSKMDELKDEFPLTYSPHTYAIYQMIENDILEQATTLRKLDLQGKFIHFTVETPLRCTDEGDARVFNNTF